MPAPPLDVRIAPRRDAPAKVLASSNLALAADQRSDDAALAQE